MRPGIEGASQLVYVVMKSPSPSMAKRRLVDRVGRIESIWSIARDAYDEVDWNIDREISRSGKQTSGYWVEIRGVLEMRK